MPDFDKTHFLNWLAVYPGGREKFAADVGYSLGTVNNWCSNRRVPPRARKCITEMMRAPREADTTVVVPLTVAEFTRIETASQADGYRSIENFARDALMEKAAGLRAVRQAPRERLRLNEPAMTQKPAASEKNRSRAG